MQTAQWNEIEKRIGDCCGEYCGDLPKSLRALNVKIKITQCDLMVNIELILPFLWEAGARQMETALTPKIKDFLKSINMKDIKWNFVYKITTLSLSCQTQKRIKNVKNIIAVSSGKGGVGKSSTAVNLALALQKLGAKTGILDADIYGPSIPKMLNTENQPVLSPDNKHMAPIMAYDMPTQSIGYLVDQNGAMIWRGPMASKALLQILDDTLWPELDYLVIDLPPGTGDIQLTLGQNIPVTGAVIVTTPQDVALLDVKKGIEAFKKINVPVLGIIENMSHHCCSHCGHLDPIFGEGGAIKLAEQEQIELLAHIPLDRQICADLDQGKPTVRFDPKSPLASAYFALAQSISLALYLKNKPVLDEIAIHSL